MIWQYRDIFENLADGCLLFELESGQILDANPRLAGWLGYSRSQAKALNVAALHPAGDRGRFHQTIVDVLQKGQISFSAHFLKKDKTRLPVEISASGFAKGSTTIVMGTVRIKPTNSQQPERFPPNQNSLRLAPKEKLIHTLALRTRIEKEKLIHRIALRIRESLDLLICLQTTVDEVRQFLQADRAFVFCFDSQQYGHIPAESAGAGISTTLHSLSADSNSTGSNSVAYAELLKTIPHQTNDIEQISNLVHADLFRQHHICAQLTAPIFKGETLWGMLVVHQCQSARLWQPWESDLLDKLSVQVSIALRHIELYAQLQTELAERKRIGKALRIARDQAIAATAAKSEFLAVMSHEIRTPLNGIIGMAGLLSDTVLSAEQQTYVTTISTCSDGLLSLINNILDVSKVESNSIALEKVSFSVRRCLEEAIASISSQALAKQLDVSYEICPSVPTRIVGDVTRLRQVFVNLLSNAVKFTSQGFVKVEVSGEQAASTPGYRLRATVRDTGIGIPADKFDRLFQPFSQVDASTTREYGGTGLGLTIARQLCTLMRGQLSVESEVGQGSCFTFDVNVELAEAIALSGKRILLVEDDPERRSQVSEALSQWGVDVLSTHSSYVALASMIHQSPFDAAIVSHPAPKMDSERFIYSLRSHTPSLPILMLCAQPATALPAVKQLSTPFTLESLHSALQDCLGHPILSQSTALDAALAQQFPLSILVAEDNLVNQQLIKQWLLKMGYTCTIVDNGQKVVDALRQQQYDLILMDVQMPEVDGIAATQLIHQAWPADKRPMIVAMTANATDSDCTRCLEAGMDAYISKPVDLAELVAAIKRCGMAKLTPAPAAVRLDEPPKDWIDFSALEATAEPLGGLTQGWLSPFIPIYEQQSVTLLQQIVDATQQQDQSLLAYAAHTLKSSSAALGLTRIRQHCQQLETLSKDSLPNVSHRIESSLHQLTADLKPAIQALKVLAQTLPD